MTARRTIHLSLAALLFTAISHAQTPTAPVEHMKVPGPVSFDNASYNLSWSSHPSSSYYKQEYLTRGQNPDRFKQMILLEVLTGKMSVKSIVDSKMAELKAMKAANPFVTYEISDNSKKDEYILDFLVTQNAPDGKSVSIAERNIYHYKPYTDKTGQNGVILFGISVRSYGNDTRTFLAALKTNKKDLVGKVRQFSVPAVQVTN